MLGRWYKMQNDMVFEAKIQNLDVAERYVWVIILSYASKKREGGFLPTGINPDYMSRQTNVPIDIINNAIKKFTSKEYNMLTIVDNRYFVINWKEYQSEGERVEKYKHKPKLDINPNIKIFIDFAYQENVKVGKKLLITGKDGKTVQRLFGTFNLDELKDLYVKFMNSEDSFIQEAGYSIGVFASVINKLNTAKGVVKTKEEIEFEKKKKALGVL